MTNQQHPAQFDWATELLDAQGHVTISKQEAKEIGARLRRLHAESEMRRTALLDEMQKAARLGAELETLRAKIKTMAEEHADELMVAHLDGRMRAAQPAGEYPELPGPFCAAHNDADSEWPDMFSESQMRTYADATCAMRAAQQPATAYADLMQAASDWICEHVDNGTPGVMTWAIRLQSAAQKLRASHGQAPARAIGPCVICGSDEPFTGTCGGGDSRALCKQPAPQPLPASHGNVTEVLDIPDQCPYFGPSPHRDVWLAGWYAARAAHQK